MGKATNLYRHYDSGGRLLYVGISLSAIYRLSQHLDSDWSRFIARVEIETFGDRRAALAAERMAIKTEFPFFNKVHNGGRRDYPGYTPPVGATSTKPTKPANEPYRPQNDADDEWLSMAQINHKHPRYRAVALKVPPSLQQVTFFKDGRVRGGRYFWRKLDLESALGRKPTGESHRIKAGLAGLSREMFTPNEWHLISSASADLPA